MKRAVVAILLLCATAGWVRSAWAVILTWSSPPVLSITDSMGSFTLSFPDFLNGTTSATQSVTYRVRANNMPGGELSGAVSARLDQLFEGIDLQADVNTYQNLGTPSYALLQEAQSGYWTVQTAQTALANKTAGVLLNGTLTVTWRARLTADAVAGQRSRFLVVTLRDS